MSWTRKLSKTFRLSDGRMIATLAVAHDLIAKLPLAHQKKAYWLRATELLVSASQSGQQAVMDRATEQMELALKAEGLI